MDRMTAEQKNRRGASIFTVGMFVAVLWMLVQVVTSLPSYFEQRAHLTVTRYGR